jgi:hypothetical protein
MVLLVPSIAQAEARFALLISNQSYDPSVGVFRNPYNDIAVVCLWPCSRQWPIRMIGATIERIRSYTGSVHPSGSCLGCAGFRPAEHDTVDPHAMQDRSELARHGTFARLRPRRSATSSLQRLSAEKRLTCDKLIASERDKAHGLAGAWWTPFRDLVSRDTRTARLFQDQAPRHNLFEAKA